MSKQIKGISIVFEGETTGLNKALGDVNKNARDVQNELKQVERLLKLDPTSSELLAQKQKLLSDAVANSKEKLDRLRAAQEQVNEQFAKGQISEEQYRAFQREVVKAEQELKRFEQQLGSTKKSLDEIGQSMQAAGQKMTDAGKNLSMNVTAPVLGLGAAVAKLGMDFETGLAKASTLFGDVEVSSEKLKKGLTDLSNELNVSTNVLNEGLYSALSAGVPVTEDMAEAMAFLEQNAKLAKGGFTDVNTAVDTTTTVLNAYGLAADEVGRVSDILINTQNAGKTTVGELGSALANVVPTAAALGVEFEQVGASLATMTAQGVPTAQATTQLRQLFVELSKSGTKAYEAFEQLSGKSFKEYIAAGGTVAEATQLMSNYAQSAGLEINDLFGSVEAANAALILASDNGASKFAESLQLMETGAGATDTAFGKMTDTTGEKFTKALNKLKNAALGFFDLMAPALESIASILDVVVTALASMSPATQKTILAIAGLAAAIGPLLVVLGVLAGSIGSIIGFFAVGAAGVSTFGVVLAALTGPIGITIAMLAALVAAGVLVYKNWDKIKAVGLQAWGELKRVVLNAVDTLLAAYEKLWGWVPGIGDKIRDTRSNMSGAIQREEVPSRARAMASQMDSTIDETERYVQAQKNATRATADTGAAAAQATKTIQTLGDVTSNAGGKTAKSAETTKAAWENAADILGIRLAILRTQHDIAGIAAELHGDKIQALVQRSDQLSKQLDIQKQIVAAVNSGYEESARTKGTTAEATEKLRLKLEQEKKAQAELEKQIKSATQAVREHAKQLRDMAAEVDEVERKYREGLAAALEDYARKVEDTNRRLAEDERKLTQQYEAEVDRRAAALRNFVGLFDEIKPRDVSGEQLLANLKDQVDAFDDWQQNIAELAAKGVDEGLLDELKQMGPKAGPEIAALNKLTDDQLGQYVSLWQQKLRASRVEAVNQLQQQNVEMQQKLMEIRAAAAEQLELYRAEWEKKNAEIRKNAEGELEKIQQKFDETAAAGTKQGMNLILNFAAGMESQFDLLRQKVAGALDIVSALDPAVRHSPSLIDRVQAGLKEIVNAYRAAAAEMKTIDFRGSMAALSPAVSASAIANNRPVGSERIVLSDDSLRRFFETLRVAGAGRPSIVVNVYDNVFHDGRDAGNKIYDSLRRLGG